MTPEQLLRAIGSIDEERLDATEPCESVLQANERYDIVSDSPLLDHYTESVSDPHTVTVCDRHGTTDSPVISGQNPTIKEHTTVDKLTATEDLTITDNLTTINNLTTTDNLTTINNLTTTDRNINSAQNKEKLPALHVVLRRHRRTLVLCACLLLFCVSVPALMLLSRRMGSSGKSNDTAAATAALSEEATEASNLSEESVAAEEVEEAESDNKESDEMAAGGFSTNDEAEETTKDNGDEAYSEVISYEDTIFALYDQKSLKHYYDTFSEEPALSVEVRMNSEPSAAPVICRDRDTIVSLFHSLCQITVAKSPSESSLESTSDKERSITFEMPDGNSFTLQFKGERLSVNGRNYGLKNTVEFWDICQKMCDAFGE